MKGLFIDEDDIVGNYKVHKEKYKNKKVHKNKD
jgi:hypothetical protein